MRPKVVIWGASGHALVVADIIKRAGQYELAGFLDNVNRIEPGTTVAGKPVHASFADLKRSTRGVAYLVFGFGHCQARLDLAETVRKEGLAFATAIHPTAILADVEIGEGTVIAAGAIINSAAKIGRNVIINTGATVDHECVIGDAAHICPGVHLAGKVQVGQGTWVGIGSTVIDKIRIGAGAMIGAGSVVVRDIPDRVTAYGSPAKVRRTI